ncbi:MAG TPA: transcriptional repressor [Acidimicrobiales bacterium]|nr:transcriptional repressor [Acidimicrobiales bacterium]
MREPAELVTAFREAGRKVTPQREAIFRILHGNPAHPTAESVFVAAQSQMPTISLKTVYTTLNELVEMGEVQAVEVGTGAARFDPDCDPHHHLVCARCGAVRDLFADFDHVVVPVGMEQGFEVGRAEVVFRGLCENCKANETPATAGRSTGGD